MAEQAQQDTAPPSRDGIIRWWDLLVAFFGGSVAGVVLSAVLGVAAILIAMRAGFQPTAANVMWFVRTSFAANQALLVASDLGLLVVVWLVARRRFARPLAHYFAPAGAGTLLL